MIDNAYTMIPTGQDNKKNYIKKAKIFNAISHPTRLRIVHLISLQEKVCAGQIQQLITLTKQNYIFHIKVLKTSGLITSKKNKANVFYEITPKGKYLLEVMLNI